MRPNLRFTDVREKIVSNPEWFIAFKPEPPWNNSKCTLGNCSHRR
jgi:hypothetical protein